MRRWRGKHRWLTALLQLYNSRCQLCGVCVRLDVESRHPLRATIDHIVARSRGGADSLENFQLACNKCNQSKGTSPVEDLIRAKTLTYTLAERRRKK